MTANLENLWVRKVGLHPSGAAPLGTPGLPPLLVMALGFGCIFAFASFPVAAQPQSSTPTSIEGIILDQNGAALSGALVAISTIAFSAQVRSDANGRFRFDSAPPAILTLTVTAEGFAQVERKLDVVGYTA